MTSFSRIMAAMVISCLVGVPATKALAQPESLPWLPAINFLLLAEKVIQLPPPANQFNIGDSIGVGEAADDTIFSENPESVWSTGYAQNDGVQSLNERFEALNQADYYENTMARNNQFNQAVSGAVMEDFVDQANAVIDAALDTPGQAAGMVTVLLGANDVCAPSLAAMTDPGVFESQYRSGLDTLASSPATSQARVQVSSIPAIYWLWEAKRNQFGCPLIWNFVPCENLLDNPGDDCLNSTSRQDPDTVYAGDGPACTRRKEFHALIRDQYNPRLQSVLEEYRGDGRLPNAEYVDLFDVRFESQHINNGDCFHPSQAGHALLSEVHWCRTAWGSGDPGCGQF